MKNNTILLVVLLGGAGAYYWYMKNKEKNANTPTPKPEGDTSGSGDTSNAGGTQYNPLGDKNSTEYKIAQLQELLGVAIDGIAGQQTNGALEKKLNGLSKGNVNAANIDFYLSEIERITGNQKKQDSATLLRASAQLIKDAYNRGGVIKTNAVRTYAGVVLDKARNVFQSTGTSYKLGKNATFIVPESLSRSRVKITHITTQGNLVINVNPAFGSAYSVLVPPHTIYVA